MSGLFYAVQCAMHSKLIVYSVENMQKRTLAICETQITKTTVILVFKNVSQTSSFLKKTSLQTAITVLTMLVNIRLQMAKNRTGVSITLCIATHSG